MPEPSAMTGTDASQQWPGKSRGLLVLQSSLVIVLATGAVVGLSSDGLGAIVGVFLLLATAAAVWMAFTSVGVGNWILNRRLVGPLYVWEIIRLARRGRSTALRTSYALVLAAGLCVIYAQQFTGGDVLSLLDDAGQRISLQDLADYSRRFVNTTLMLQGLAVIILTPPYIAGAISEEKERSTLELLFTTHLHDHEIVMGKLLARVTHLAGILLAGLPILSLAQLWGGVDMLVLAAMTVVTLVSLLSYGSICILVSVQSKQTWVAVLTSYLAVAGLATCCGCVPLIHLTSPLGFLAELSRQMAGGGWLFGAGPGLPADPFGVVLSLVGQYVVMHSVISMVCLTWASRELRSTSRSAPPKPLPRVERIGGWDPVPAPIMPLPKSRAPSLLSYDPRHPLGDRPLLWKETYHGTLGTSAGFLIDMATILFAVFLIIEGVLLFTIGVGTGRHWFDNFMESIQEFVNPSIRVVTVILGLLLCAGVAFRAAGTFSKERDQKTLDSLLLLPIARRELLFSKWLGSILRLRRLMVLLAVLWVFGMLVLAVHPLAVLMLAVAMAIHVALLASIGIWLSLACRNTVSAYFAMALMMMLVFLGSWLVLLNTTISGPMASPGWGEWLERFLEVGLSPLSTWWVVADNLIDMQNHIIYGSPKFWRTLTAVSAGLVVFTLLGLLVWAAAEQRLGGEPRRLMRRPPVLISSLPPDPD